VSLLSILEMGTCALAAVSEKRLLALLIIKLEPLTSVHTSWSAVLCRERWPGRRHFTPVVNYYYYLFVLTENSFRYVSVSLYGPFMN